MRDLKPLIAAFAQPGRVDWIGVRPARRATIVSVDAVQVSERGFVGDHGASDRRAVTLVQAEHLVAIGSMLGLSAVPAQDLRRNLVVSGINLAALKGRLVRIGTSTLEITGICAPCSRMEETFGYGGYSAVRGHGGMCARVIAAGAVRLGDRVLPLTSPSSDLSKTG